jgi:hypothetical protein
LEPRRNRTLDVAKGEFRMAVTRPFHCLAEEVEFSAGVLEEALEEAVSIKVRFMQSTA